MPTLAVFQLYHDDKHQVMVKANLTLFHIFIGLT